MKLRKGLEILEDIPGIGEEIQKLRSYRMNIQMWLNKGGPVVWRNNIPDQFQEFAKLSQGRTVQLKFTGIIEKTLFREYIMESRE